MLVSHIALYGSIAIQDMANLFKFIPFTTSSIPIGFINPLQVPPKELYSKAPNRLFACCNNIQMSSYSNSINREKKILTEKNKPSFFVLFPKFTKLSAYFCQKKKSIYLANGLSGPKDGCSEKQSITNFWPVDFHNKRGALLLKVIRAAGGGKYDDNKLKLLFEV